MSTLDTFKGELHYTGRTSKPRGGLSVNAVIAWVEHKLERRRSRLALMEMTDDMLKDIGVSRSEAYREANRPFWQ